MLKGTVFMILVQFIVVPDMIGQDLFPKYSKVKCLTLNGKVFFSTEDERNTYSIYHRDNILYAGEFTNNDITVPDSLNFELYEGMPEDELVHYIDKRTKFHIKDNDIRIISSTVVHEDSIPHHKLFNSTNLKSETITPDNIYLLIPEGQFLIDYLTKDINDDNYEDLLVFYGEDEIGETEGTLEVLMGTKTGLKSAQKLPSTWIELYSISYLDSDFEFPIIFLTGSISAGNSYYTVIFFFISGKEEISNDFNFESCDPLFRQIILKLKK